MTVKTALVYMIALFVLAPAVSALIVTNSLGASLFALGMMFAIVIALNLKSMNRLAIWVVGALLTGFALLDRGFAHVAIGSFDIGTIVLTVAFIAFVVSGGIRHAFRSPLTWILLMYLCWGLMRTVPYISSDGMNAMRDGVLWGYGVFAILVSSWFIQTGRLHVVPERFAQWVPRLLIWLPIIISLNFLFGSRLPKSPGSTVSIFLIDPGDTAVLLSGIAAFLLLRLHKPERENWMSRSEWGREWLLWGLWLLSTFYVVSYNRGGMLAICSCLFVVLLFRPRSGWGKVVMLSITFVSMLIAFASNVDLTLKDNRHISVQQIVSNFESIVGIGSPQHTALADTAQWRLQWWNEIIHYTIFGPYFWTGKGYGINLATADGFQVYANQALRAPHNGHLDILARSGVPGFAMWILIQIMFCTSLIRAYLYARKKRWDFWARLNLWILAYWVAFTVNASFDVYLEGPQGGIWFFSLMGYGMGLVHYQKRLRLDESKDEEVERISSWNLDTVASK